MAKKVIKVKRVDGVTQGYHVGRGAEGIKTSPEVPSANALDRMVENVDTTIEAIYSKFTKSEPALPEEQLPVSLSSVEIGLLNLAASNSEPIKVPDGWVEDKLSQFDRLNDENVKRLLSDEVANSPYIHSTHSSGRDDVDYAIQKHVDEFVGRSLEQNKEYQKLFDYRNELLNERNGKVDAAIAPIENKIREIEDIYDDKKRKIDVGERPDRKFMESDKRFSSRLSAWRSAYSDAERALEKAMLLETEPFRKELHSAEKVAVSRMPETAKIEEISNQITSIEKSTRSLVLDKFTNTPKVFTFTALELNLPYSKPKNAEQIKLAKLYSLMSLAGEMQLTDARGIQQKNELASSQTVFGYKKIVERALRV